jgi:putative membrane protein
MGEGFGHGFGHGIGGLWMVLLWLIPILLVVWGLASFRGGGRGGSARSARELLDEEYARGRIDREEYLRRKKDLAA